MVNLILDEQPCKMEELNELWLIIIINNNNNMILKCKNA